MKIGIVIVTYNRIEELKKSLACYEEQTKKPEYIIVVDNHSSDGTDFFLDTWKNERGVCERIVLSLEDNLGGAGGFYYGMKAASERTDADWIWVADDDAFPEKNALEIAEQFAAKYPDEIKNASAICGMCEYEGRVASVQRGRFKKTFLGTTEVPVSKEEFQKEYFYLDLYSFVGTIMKREALRKAGLPRKEFFIYQDDYEHAVRMGKIGKLICVPGVVIHHKDNYFYDRGVTWRDYYATRNIIILYKEHLDKKSLKLRILRRKLAAWSSFNYMKIKVINDAIRDGKEGNVGIHSVYKPGWKV